jgi:hypothetical protein
MNSALGNGFGDANHLYEILVVNPRDELTAIAGPPAEATPDQAHERVEDPARVGTHRHSRPERDLPCPGGRRLLERLLPGARDVDAEAPCVRRVHLVSTEHS